MSAQASGCFLYIQAALGERTNGANQRRVSATGVRLAHPIGDEPERSPVGAMNHKLRQVDIGKMAERAIA